MRSAAIGAPSAERTALALHQAISRRTNPAWPVQGLPDVLYSDHGSDFTSSRLDWVCLDTHIRLIHSRVGVPQGRGKIERLFRTITTELLPHLPGHIPHGTGGRPVTPPRLTLAQLDAAIEGSSSAITTPEHIRRRGQPPVQRWLADGWVPRAPAQPEDLDLCRAIAPELAGDAVTLEQLQSARTARRRALKQQLRDRRSLADALPDDHRYAVELRCEPTVVPGVQAPAPMPAPRHRPRTYAND